ncbi:MAG: type II toxin-antitoxin system HipA family toxin, partial [Steroidobacteraceae bacterium]
TGPITSLEQLIHGSTYFGLQPIEAQEEASAMAAAVASWCEIATSKEVGLTDAELHAFAPAFQQRE